MRSVIYLKIWEKTVKSWQQANGFAPLPVPEMPFTGYHKLCGRQKALIDAYHRNLGKS